MVFHKNTRVGRATRWSCGGGALPRISHQDPASRRGTPLTSVAQAEGGISPLSRYSCMSKYNRSCRALSTLALAFACELALTTCGRSVPSPIPLAPLPPPPAGKHFTHIVVLIQENRTFDNFFATFPGADGTRVGKTHNGSRRLREADLYSQINPSNQYVNWKRDCNRGSQQHCQMNGFDTVPIGRTPGTYVYEFVDPPKSSRIGTWPDNTC